MESNGVQGNHWVAYFDILGFENMLCDFKRKFPCCLDLFVKNHYWDVLDAMKKETAYCPDVVSLAWFSDSFLLFSRDDSLKSFACVASAAGGFFREAVGQMMPPRGALGFGDFYADVANTIFVGDALIDAYQYAEQQDWIGLVITPSAYKAHEQFHDSSLVRDRDFVEHEVVLRENASERLYAYRPDTNCDFLDHMLDQIRQMQSSAKRDHPVEYEQKYRYKYERTIRFYEESPRTGIRTTWRKMGTR